MIPTTPRISNELRKVGVYAPTLEQVQYWLMNHNKIVTVGYTRNNKPMSKSGLFVGLVKEGNARLVAATKPYEYYGEALEEAILIGIQKSGVIPNHRIIQMHGPVELPKDEEE